MMRAALYIRVSTQEQAQEGFSINAQRLSLVSYCESMEYQISEIYVDDGYSAKDMNRPQLQKLLSDADERLFDTVIVHKLDRFSRNVSNMYELVERLRKCGVSFQSKQEKFDTGTPMGSAVMGILIVLAQWERETIAERVRFGVEQMVREGKRPGSVIPYGYTSDQEIIPEEANIIRYIRDIYMSGYGYNTIAKRLNREGELRRGSEWSQSTVAYTLENPYYAGIIRMGTKLPSGGYANGNRDDRVKCIYGEGSHPPIFTKEEYEQHKNFMKRKSHNGFSRQKVYWFSGVLRCGRCGAAMFGRLTTKRNRGGEIVRTPYYICSNKHSGRSCDMPTFRQHHVEHLLMDYIYRTRLDAVQVQYEAEAISEVAAATENELEDYQKELGKIKERKKKWQYMFVEGLIDSDTVRERVKEENEKEEALQRMITDINVITETAPDVTRLTDIYELWDKLDDDDKKELIYIIFNRITLFTEMNNIKGVKNKFFDASIEVTYN